MHLSGINIELPEGVLLVKVKLFSSIFWEDVFFEIHTFGNLFQSQSYSVTLVQLLKEPL